MGKITSTLEKRIILCASTAQMMPKRNYRSRESFPDGIYLLKVNNKNIRTKCEICSKLTIQMSTGLFPWRPHKPKYLFNK